MKATINATNVVNLNELVNLKTNLALVRMEGIETSLSEISELSIVNDDNIELLSNEKISWKQWGYLCSIPNGMIVLKLKRFIPTPAPTGNKVSLTTGKEISFFNTQHIFKKESVVLATSYFPHEEENTEKLKKIKALKPGDTVSIIEDGQKLTATILSSVEAIETKAIGRIPHDYISHIFELQNVEVQ